MRPDSDAGRTPRAEAASWRRVTAGACLAVAALAMSACSRTNPWFGSRPGDEEDTETTSESSGDVALTAGSEASLTGGASAAATTTGAIDPGTSGPMMTTTTEMPGEASSSGGETSSGGSSTSTSSEPDTTDGDTGGSSDTGDATCSKCSEAGCGPCPVVVQVPFDGKFTIDMYEVRNKDYEVFAAAPVSLEIQIPACAWNDDFTPQQPWPQDAAKGKLPVVFVDWCDADAYCRWAGKRLCGRIGGGSGPTKVEEIFNKNIDQWYRACSGTGGNLYPYGATYEAGRCNDVAASKGGPVEVGEMLSCEGSGAGLFDMSGNVWEMTDACESDAPFARCLRRGGGWKTSLAKDLRCDLQSLRERNLVYDHVGFRCCTDL